MVATRINQKETNMSEVSYDKNHSEQFLGAGLIAYSSALTVTLKSMAEVHGTEDMTWFDEIHAAAVKEAKGTITENIPIDVESQAIAFGFTIVDASFKSIRKQIVEGK